MMKIRYTLKDLDAVYERIVSLAEKNFKKDKFNASLEKIQVAARLQYNVSSCYSDIRLENLMMSLSNKILPFPDDFKPISGKVLFYDYFGISNRGLTQQYLDALFQIEGMELCYVKENTFTEQTEDILYMVRSHGSMCYELTQSTIEKKIEGLYNIIRTERPSSIFFHISPWSPIPLVASKVFPSIRKILINITDHTFGLGDGKFFDFSFEFREFGCKVSMERRNYQASQILLLPYYPWQEITEFQGFPVDTDGKVILFSGAFMHKIEDSENTFFHIVARILKANPDTIMFFAGAGNPTRTQKLIEENNLSDRFFFLGNRTDISEIFKYIDIYIGTYPIVGGLMSQYASINGVPILAYKNHQIEKIVCNRRWMDFVFDSIDDLVTEATHLVSDNNYRRKRGRDFQSLTATQTDFRKSFIHFYNNPTGLNITINEFIDYDKCSKTDLDHFNNSNNFQIEHQIMKHCPFALHWKMLFNVLLNENVLKMFFKNYVKKKTS